MDARQYGAAIGDIAHGQRYMFLLGIGIFKAVEREFAPSSRQAGGCDEMKRHGGTLNQGRAFYAHLWLARSGRRRLECVESVLFAQHEDIIFLTHFRFFQKAHA
jgi:hypothetical protein